MGRNAFEVVQAQFSEATMVDRYEEGERNWRTDGSIRT
jgi:hypothetical protein